MHSNLPALHSGSPLCLCCGRGLGSIPRRLWCVGRTLLVFFWLKPPTAESTGTSTSDVHRGSLCRSCLSSLRLLPSSLGFKKLPRSESLRGRLLVVATCRDVLGRNRFPKTRHGVPGPCHGLREPSSLPV
jgi:hypothetical protein